MRHIIMRAARFFGFLQTPEEIAEKITEIEKHMHTEWCKLQSLKSRGEYHAAIHSEEINECVRYLEHSERQLDRLREKHSKLLALA